MTVNLRTRFQATDMSAPNDPFSLLGLPPSFDLDPKAIEHAYLLRAAAAHPDLSPEPDDSDALASHLNLARQTLLDPEQRAAALLTLRGGPSKESNKSLPPGFLMDFMETREQIDIALAARDPARIRHWRQWALDQRAAYIAKVSQLFRDASSHNSVDIRTTLNAWRYIERLIEQLTAPSP